MEQFTHISAHSIKNNKKVGTILLKNAPSYLNYYVQLDTYKLSNQSSDWSNLDFPKDYEDNTVYVR